MQALLNINLVSLADSLVSLVTAFTMGALIGFERQYRQRTAGLRTNVLVAVGAAVFVDLANRLNGAGSAAHVAAYVVSGVGFLGAGVIMREEGNVRGLNTAATLWGAAAVGACAGADLILESILAASFVLMANTLLRPVVNTINRKPIDVISTEVTNTITVIAGRDKQNEAMTVLKAELERSNYPAGDIDLHAFGHTEVLIEAELMATSVDGDELDALVDRLTQFPVFHQVFWNPSLSE